MGLDAHECINKQEKMNTVNLSLSLSLRGTPKHKQTCNGITFKDQINTANASSSSAKREFIILWPRKLARSDCKQEQTASKIRLQTRSDWKQDQNASRIRLQERSNCKPNQTLSKNRLQGRSYCKPNQTLSKIILLVMISMNQTGWLLDYLQVKLKCEIIFIQFFLLHLFSDQICRHIFYRDQFS